MSENKENKQGGKNNPFDKMKERGPRKPQGPKSSFNFYWIYAIIILALIAINFINFSDSPEEIYQAQFDEMVTNHDVKEIEIINKQIAEISIKPEKLNSDKYKNISKKHFSGSANSGPHFSYKFGDLNHFQNELDALQKDVPQSERVPYKNVDRTNWGDQLSWIIPFAVLILIWVFIMRRMSGGGGAGQIFSIGKSKAQLFDKDTNVQITFNDVAGLEGAKIEIKEIVDFLKNPKKYTALGAKIPKGALLVGPP